MKKNYLLLLFMGLILTSCFKNKEGRTSISGEIFNPRSSSIVILRNDQLIDTVPLNEHSNFHYQFDKNIEEGLYTLIHDYGTHNETQMFYLEKGDSLQLRVNTQEFDESLMYSGQGAIANNFLMILFLDAQEKSSSLLQYYKYKPDVFIKKADSVRQDYLAYVKKLSAEGSVSERFENLAYEILDYSYYDFMERYFFLVNKYNKNLRAQIPEDYMDYRKSANLNHPDLQKYYLYQRFLDDYLKNSSVLACQQNPQLNENCFDLHTKENLYRRIEMADSLFELPSLRKRFLRAFGARLIVKANTAEEVDSIRDFLEDAKLEEAEMKNIRYLASIQKSQFIGNIGSVVLESAGGDLVSINEIADKPTVFYYWSLHFESLHKSNHLKIEKLKNLYPEVNFVAINIDFNDKSVEGSQSFWHSGMKKFGYNPTSEYRLVCDSEQRVYYRNYINKVVMIDSKGEIINGDLNIQDRLFEEKLLGLINRSDTDQ